VQNSFLVYLWISTIFGRLWVHQQEKQLCFCDTWYLLVCVDDCLVCRLSTLHTRQSSTQNNKYQVSHKWSCFSWWWTHIRPKHVEKRNKHSKKNCAPSWLYLQDLQNNTHHSDHSTLHTRHPPTQNNKKQVSHRYSCFSWRWAHSHPKLVEIHKYKYTKNKLCIKLALFTRLNNIFLCSS